MEFAGLPDFRSIRYKTAGHSGHINCRASAQDLTSRPMLHHAAGQDNAGRFRQSFYEIICVPADYQQLVNNRSSE